jgi:hypothetical protein
MTNQELFQSALSFEAHLEGLKKDINKNQSDKINWYPYGTLHNFSHLNVMLGDRYNLLELMGSKVADIGGSDGDLSFFVESLGIDSDLIENPVTQHNGLRGANALKQRMNSKVNLIETDIDRYFEIPATYNLTFFLGILYHLQNPYNVLNNLKNYTKYCLLSTRIAAWAPIVNNDQERTYIGNLPVAYLLDSDECNNDATNYWIFSKPGLERILDRTGWDILAFHCFGDTENSNPRDGSHDERYFCLLKSRLFG